MEHVLVRYGEIGTKSRRVAGGMINRLADRVAERLDYEGLPVERVETISGRVLVETEAAEDTAAAVGELPGVASASPAVRVAPELPAIRAAADRFPVGETFAIDAHTAGDHAFRSHDLNREVGASVEDRTGATVDLDDPDTTIEIDARGDAAYVFATRFEGPGGYPVGSQEPLAALISGGIDSPVAAHAVMTRGARIVPVYCYNRPFAAGDHRIRFEESLDALRRFDPGREWYYHLVDMEAVNEALADVERGRMLLHRIVMFRVAARIAVDEGLRGVVTGESIGQKSSQTTANLALTSAAISLPVHRPLLAEPKERITERARELGTYESAVVDSACRTIAPDQPATAMHPDHLDDLRREVGIDDLVGTAYAATERVDL